jgi:hypothetical protein
MATPLMVIDLHSKGPAAASNLHADVAEPNDADGSAHELDHSGDLRPVGAVFPLCGPDRFNTHLAIRRLFDRTMSGQDLVRASQHEGHGVLRHRHISEERQRSDRDATLRRGSNIDVLAVEPVLLDEAQSRSCPNSIARKLILIHVGSVGLWDELVESLRSAAYIGEQLELGRFWQTLHLLE